MDIDHARLGRMKRISQIKETLVFLNDNYDKLAQETSYFLASKSASLTFRLFGLFNSWLVINSLFCNLQLSAGMLENYTIAGAGKRRFGLRGEKASGE